jgi:hypothetical protein
MPWTGALPPDHQRCTAHNRAGTQCKKYRRHGYAVCEYHGGGRKGHPPGAPIQHGRRTRTFARWVSAARLEQHTVALKQIAARKLVTEALDDLLDGVCSAIAGLTDEQVDAIYRVACDVLDRTDARVAARNRGLYTSLLKGESPLAPSLP